MLPNVSKYDNMKETLKIISLNKTDQQLTPEWQQGKLEGHLRGKSKQVEGTDF